MLVFNLLLCKARCHGEIMSLEVVKPLHGFVSILLLCALQCTVHADALTDEAERLINERQSQQAYELLIKQLLNRSGTVDYDLLLGIAALNSGHPTEAVFAFERVLDVDPDNSRARAELGRAYFEMGENAAAREEFNNVNRQEIPETIGSTIDEYLAELDARLATTKKRFTAFAEVALGYDSNVNSATDSSTIAIPAIGNLSFTLDDSSQELDSGFIEGGFGAAFSMPWAGTDNLGVFGSANFHEKYSWDETDFRTRSADAQLGLSYTREKNQYRISILGQHFGLDKASYRNLGGGRLAWLHTWNDRTIISSYAQWAVERYLTVGVRDVNSYSGGIGVIHLMNRTGTPVISATIFGGTDDEVDNSRSDVGRNYIGVRMSGEYNYNEKTKLFGNFTYQFSDYGSVDPLFREEREDNFIFLRAGVEYAVGKNWYVKPEVQYLLSDSTIPINDYNRWQLMATARYNF